MGSTTAFETRYEVRTHVASSRLAESPPAMCGSATLAMAVSSTSMNVARVTVNATAHGLWRGLQLAWSSGPATEASLPDVDRDVGGLSCAQRHPGGHAVERDAHRDALSDLHEVAGGVVGGKEREARAGPAGQALHLSTKRPPVGVHLDVGPLADLHL